jgi:hypothetical protein
VGSQSHCSFNLPTQPSIPLDSSQQSYDAHKRPSSITEEEEENMLKPLHYLHNGHKKSKNWDGILRNTNFEK